MNKAKPGKQNKELYMIFQYRKNWQEDFFSSIKLIAERIA
jgi:hypothetical protein